MQGREETHRHALNGRERLRRSSVMARMRRRKGGWLGGTRRGQRRWGSCGWAAATASAQSVVQPPPSPASPHRHRHSHYHLDRHLWREEVPTCSPTAECCACRTARHGGVCRKAARAHYAHFPRACLWSELPEGSCSHCHRTSGYPRSSGGRSKGAGSVCKCGTCGLSLDPSSVGFALGPLHGGRAKRRTAVGRAFWSSISGPARRRWRERSR